MLGIVVFFVLGGCLCQIMGSGPLCDMYLSWDILDLCVLGKHKRSFGSVMRGWVVWRYTFSCPDLEKQRWARNRLYVAFRVLRQACYLERNPPPKG